MRILLVFFLFLITAYTGKAQPSTNDIQVILNQNSLNKLFLALGPVFGSGNYTLLFWKGSYQWTLESPHIELSDNCADFQAQVTVDSGPFRYQSYISGDVSIIYLPDSNKIVIQVTSAILPLYVNLFGSKTHVKNIDLASSFKDPFKFDGPLSLTSDMDFTMPDGYTRRVHALPVNCQIIVSYHQIIVPCGIEFVTVSIKK